MKLMTDLLPYKADVCDTLGFSLLGYVFLKI